MTTFKALMSNQKLLPIIQANTPEEGVSIAGAMREAGIHLVEVVLRTEASLEALTAIKEAYPDLTVGAGTVVSLDTLQKAIASGADFIVTPGLNANLAEALKSCGVPVLPGVSSVADILTALDAGFSDFKLFPASLSGGAKFIAAMKGLFPNSGFCPTGGVSLDNKDEYLALDNCFAVGGTWVSKADWVKAGDWRKITDACLEANR